MKPGTGHVCLWQKRLCPSIILPEEALDVCFEELKNCGQGRLELVSLDKKAGHAVIRCYQSFEVDAVKGIKLYRTPRVSCDLLRGELSACLSVILGCQWSVWR